MTELSKLYTRTTNFVQRRHNLQQQTNTALGRNEEERERHGDFGIPAATDRGVQIAQSPAVERRMPDLGVPSQ